jgi:hypothetical protein
MRQSAFLLLTASIAIAACGGDKTDDAKVKEGAVVYRDALRDNRGGWLLHKDLVTFDQGGYRWRITAGNTPVAGPDELLKHPIPKGLAISVGVQVDEGAALRAIDCRELGPAGNPSPTDWYELGVDGRQALIRRMASGSPPKILARRKLSIPNGRRVKLTAQCVPDAGRGLVLALRVDGKPMLSARDAKPLPAERDGNTGTPAIRAYRRPDSAGPAAVTWQDFEVRSAAVQ